MHAETAGAQSRLARIGEYSFDEFCEEVTRFHGYPAPGVLLGGFMVEEAKRHCPPDVLLDAVCETSWCLPDSIQMLTACSTGNGWLRVINLGRYALTLFDKHEGSGARVALDPAKLQAWPAIADWYLKRKPKAEQDSVALREQIRLAGASVCSVEHVTVRSELLRKRGKGSIAICPLCREAYPSVHGEICRGCQGEAPYVERLADRRVTQTVPPVRSVPVAEAVGLTALHDMTRIEPGASKGAEFLRGQRIEAGDVCRLQQMGRFHLYVQDQDAPAGDWVHEDKAAEAFAAALAGQGTRLEGPPREGKINLVAERDGLLLVDEPRLQRFNLLPDVMAASRKSHSLVKAGARVAATRAIPLHLSAERFRAAMAMLADDPLVEVRPLIPLKAGILITGNEVFQGLIEDKFEAVVRSKLARFGCPVVGTVVAPDDREAIVTGLKRLVDAGSGLVVTTAGLSVDPDDVTRQGLLDAGVENALYGMPVLPGAMTLLARLGPVRIIGVPACALFFKTTSLDILLPRVLAGVEITRADLSRLANGGMCMECKTCTYPKCPFGT